MSPRRCVGLFFTTLLLSWSAPAPGAELKVAGNSTSDVLASGWGTDGELVSEHFSEHMGTTDWVPATADGVSRAQDLLAQAPMALGQIKLSGHAQLGHLAILGEAQAGINQPDGLVAAALGGVHAEWFSGMQLMSATLPVGTPVDLLVTLTVEGEGIADLDQGGDSNYLVSRFSFSGGLSGVPPGAGNVTCDDFVGSCTETRSFALVGQVGRSYSLRGTLDLGVTAGTTLSNDILDVVAAVVGSSTLYLDLLTPGVSYTLDDSGLQFQTGPTPPIPEPSVLALLTAGLLVLLRKRRAE